VTAETDKFYELIKIHDETHAPAILRFTWGPAGAFPGANLSSFYARQKRENGFTCVVDSVRQRFTLWNAAGVPLRATLTVSLREFKTLDGQIEELNLKSADHTHSHVVQQGETLTRIAAAVYEDAREWRRIAERNAIVDPLSLQPGTMLLVPPLT
jgi:nucleoid-associated protein YgaU